MSGNATYWLNPPKHSETLVSSILCALPFSFYGMIGAVALFRHSMLPGSALYFLALMVLSLAVCTIAVWGLFVLVVKLWPEPLA